MGFLSLRGDKSRIATHRRAGRNDKPLQHVPGPGDGGSRGGADTVEVLGVSVPNRARLLVGIL